MNILGIDIGNYATKTNKGIIFPSRLSIGHKKLNANDTKVEFEDKKYTIGTGNLALGETRYDSVLYDLCLLNAVHQSLPDVETVSTNVVVGLPPQYYESKIRDTLEKRLNDLETQKIKIDDKEIAITINKAAVFCESAIVFSNPEEYREKKTLVIDVGGGTTDISQFNGLELVNYTTTKLGMLKLDEDIRPIFNSHENANFNKDAIEEIIGKDTVTIRGDKKDIKYLEDIVRAHVTEICNTVNAGFDTDYDIKIIGGGASKLIKYFKEQYKNAEVPENNRYINAKTYETIGKVLWSE